MGAVVAVQDALWKALGELGLTVYTKRPQASDGGDPAVYPHIEISKPVFAQYDTQTENGHDYVVRIFTRWQGDNDLVGEEIQDAVYDRLHRATDLDVAGFTSVLIDRQTSFVTPLDGLFEGVCEYRGLIQAT